MDADLAEDKGDGHVAMGLVGPSEADPYVKEGDHTATGVVATGDMDSVEVDAEDKGHGMDLVAAWVRHSRLYVH